MLVSLHIQNIAVVRRADIELQSGFTVLTGETGVGKSVIIDSVKLLMGARASHEQIRNGEESATVSGLFSGISGEALTALSEIGIEPDEGGELYLSRTIYADGRGKTLVGGRQIPIQLLREIGSVLIAVHGQHENQKLLRPELHIGYLDRFAGNIAELEEYKKVYSELKRIKKEISETNRDEAEKARLIEMLRYQINDIDSARLKPGEEEELESKRIKIRSAEKLKKYVLTVYSSLCAGERSDCARDQIDRAAAALERISEIIPEALPLKDRLQSCLIEITDIGGTVYDYLDEGQGDGTAALDRIEARLETITRLKRKYGQSIAEIIGFRNKAAERLDDIEQSGEKIAKLAKKLEELTEKAKAAAEKLSATRRKAGKQLSAAVTDELAFLEMGRASFDTELRECGLSEQGADEVEFVIATNPGEPLLPLQKIASGGELSRIMLAMKCVLEDKEGTATLIFDEVDTGVSGKTAQKIGIKLRDISRSAQVICITHAAQIAALSAHHLLISKYESDGRSETRVTELDEDGRTNELARIMGGAKITETLLATARELRQISLSDG